MKTRRYLLAAFGAILMTGTAMSAHASDGIDTTTPIFGETVLSSNFAAPQDTYELLAQNKISASQAKSIARSRVGGGEVVDISRKGDTYKVRVIAKNGRVVDVYIDANTGRVKR